MIESSRILYEDNHIIIINKPSGLLVQGDATGDVPLLELLKAYLKKKYNKPGKVFLGTIHRLDRPASGCIVYAKTSKALTRMTQLFAKREIKKEYLALTAKANIPSEGTLINYIAKQTSKNKVVCLDKQTPESKKAELKFEVMVKFSDSLLLRVDLKTGRKHQIRVQLSKMGCPIAGDLKYGFDKPNSDKSICLHCLSLDFIHPVSQNSIKVISPLPAIKEWRKAINEGY